MSRSIKFTSPQRTKSPLKHASVKIEAPTAKRSLAAEIIEGSKDTIPE